MGLRDSGVTLVPPQALSGTVIAQNTSVLIANQVYLIPILGLVTPTPISRFRIRVNGQSGNMDLGLYFSDDSDVTFTRFFSTGSFLVPAAGTQIKGIVSQTLIPVLNRRWYFAFVADNAVATFTGGTPGTNVQVWGTLIRGVAFPLPATLNVTASGDTAFVPAIHALV